jgi:hypothetical protein
MRNEMKKLNYLYVFIIEEKGNEDILCYPSENGELIPMIAVDQKRLKQLEVLKVNNIKQIEYLLNNSRRTREDIIAFSKYNGKTNISVTTFDNRKDKYHFHKLSRRLSQKESICFS